MKSVPVIKKGQITKLKKLITVIGSEGTASLNRKTKHYFGEVVCKSL